MAPPIHTSEAMMLEQFPGEDDRRNIELIRCALEQIVADVLNDNHVNIISGLAQLSEESLLELLPSDHPVFMGRREPSIRSPLLLPRFELDEELHDLMYEKDTWNLN